MCKQKGVINILPFSAYSSLPVFRCLWIAFVVSTISPFFPASTALPHLPPSFIFFHHHLLCISLSLPVSMSLFTLHPFRTNFSSWIVSGSYWIAATEIGNREQLTCWTTRARLSQTHTTTHFPPLYPCSLLITLAVMSFMSMLAFKLCLLLPAIIQNPLSYHGCTHTWGLSWVAPWAI